MADTTLDLIDAELDRLRQPVEPKATIYPDPWRPRWWEIRRKAWNNGVETARSVATEKLQEIRDAYVADHSGQPTPASNVRNGPEADAS